jgi:hypothetical protein
MWNTYKIPGESKFHVTTRPIHKLVLVVLVEEQTMEEPEDLLEDQEEGVNAQESWSSSNAGERMERRRPTLGGPPLAGLATEEAGVDVSEGGNAGEVCGKEEGPEE